MEFMLVIWYRNWNFSIDTVSILLVFGEFNFQFFGTAPYCKKSYEQKMVFIFLIRNSWYQYTYKKKCDTYSLWSFHSTFMIYFYKVWWIMEQLQFFDNLKRLKNAGFKENLDGYYWYAKLLAIIDSLNEEWFQI